MKIYLFYYLIEILKAEVCLRNIRTIYKTTFPGLFKGIRETVSSISYQDENTSFWMIKMGFIDQGHDPVMTGISNGNH